jgi:CBS domain-containing protein
MRDAKVSTIMTAEPVSIGPRATLQDAAQSMRNLNIGLLVVFEDPGGVLGVVTDRDITMRATAQGRNPATTAVREVMTANAVTCHDYDLIVDAAWLMKRHAVRRLLVLGRDEQLVGVVSVDDIARALGAERLAGQVLRDTSEPTSNVLVVFYSRTGNTRKVATELAHLAGWDLEPIVDTQSRGGLLGYLRSALESIIDRRAALAPSRRDPGDYDLVVVGTPVWSGSASTPIRSWLEAQRVRLPKLAFLATEGTRGATRAFAQMAAKADNDPVATLTLATRSVERGELEPKLSRFIASITSALERTATSPSEPEPTAPSTH